MSEMLCTLCKEDHGYAVKIPITTKKRGKKYEVCCLPCFMELWEMAEIIDEQKLNGVDVGAITSLKTNLAMCVWASR